MQHLVMEESRNGRISMPAAGSSKLNSGVWTFKEQAFCLCGKSFFAEGYFPKDGPDEYRRQLIRSLRDKAQDQWWECYKSHHGEFGLDAIDGVV